MDGKTYYHIITTIQLVIPVHHLYSEGLNLLYQKALAALALKFQLHSYVIEKAK